VLVQKAGGEHPLCAEKFLSTTQLREVWLSDMLHVLPRLFASSVSDRPVSAVPAPAMPIQVVETAMRGSARPNDPPLKSQAETSLLQVQVGLVACNDYIILESCIYRILKKHFAGKSYYPLLLDFFHEVRAAPCLSHSRSSHFCQHIGVRDA